MWLRPLWQRALFDNNDIQKDWDAESYIAVLCAIKISHPLLPTGAESIVYWTLYGGIGALQAFVSREDVDFFLRLEMHLRGAWGAREPKPKEGSG